MTNLLGRFGVCGNCCETAPAPCDTIMDDIPLQLQIDIAGVTDGGSGTCLMINDSWVVDWQFTDPTNIQWLVDTTGGDYKTTLTANVWCYPETYERILRVEWTGGFTNRCCTWEVSLGYGIIDGGAIDVELDPVTYGVACEATCPSTDATCHVTSISP